MSRPICELSRTTIALHWLSALAIVGLIAFGLVIGSMPRGPDKVALIQMHKSFGMVALPLLLARLVWRLREGWPPPASSGPAVELLAARAVHWFLLIAPLVMIATGIGRSLTYARSVDLFGLPLIPRVMETVNEPIYQVFASHHDTTAIVIIVVLSLHVAAALRHHVIRRDETLTRMLGRISRGGKRPTA